MIRFPSRCLSSKAWLKRHVNDEFVKMAAGQNLRSRSAFKLRDINDKYKIIRSSDSVIDLGASPGGWSQLVSEIVHGNGKVIAIDLLPIESISGCIVLQGDMRSMEMQEKIKICLGDGNLANVVISDMLQNTCGHQPTDHFRSMELCHDVLEFCDRFLLPRGTLLCKYLRGSDEKELLDAAKQLFLDVKVVKPKASRLESAEIYLLARQKKDCKNIGLL